MNIENSKINSSKNIMFKGKEMPNSDNSTIEKSVLEMFIKSRQLLPQDSAEDFEPIKAEYNNSSGKFVLSVRNGINRHKQPEKKLEIIYVIDGEENERAYSLILAHGTKQELLDYLGNEKNLEDVKMCMNRLQTRAKQD